MPSSLAPLPSALLPTGIRSHFQANINGLRMHVLEAGKPGQPLLLLLHGFPELAYSWRKVMVPLAEAGFHVVAPDLRGYGRTTGVATDFDVDLRQFSMLTLARDVVALAHALGARHVSTLVGHDFGSPLAAWCALARPDLFKSVVLMSAPFAGPPTQLGGCEAEAQFIGQNQKFAAELLALQRPRQHYHWYYSKRAANADMHLAGQRMQDFLRAYFHMKSADWTGNAPYKLGGWTADELAKLPAYYVMDANTSMPATVAPHLPPRDLIQHCRWMTEVDMQFYSEEYSRTGFQGGLNWYRTRFDPTLTSELSLYAGRSIDQPSLFVAGRQDWGIYQVPGAIERMNGTACTQMEGVHLIDRAGHWVMQENPERTLEKLVPFVTKHRA